MSRILVITGPSGAGKSTVIEYLLRKPVFKLSISYTTRTPRPDEEDGKDYVFVSKEDFENKIKEDFFLEYTEYFGNYYGTPMGSLDHDSILIMDVNQGGLEFFKERFPRSFFCLVYIERAKLEKRLFERMQAHEQYTEEQFLDRMKKYDLFDELRENFTFNMIIDNSKSMEHLLDEAEVLADRVIRYYQQ